MKTGGGSGVKHLARIASRPVTWVIKIKHAGLNVLGQNRKENYGIYILDSCTNPGACSIFIYGALGINLSPDPIEHILVRCLTIGSGVKQAWPQSV